MNDIQVIRQLLLDLLTEYQQLEKPANPELLRLHIEAYEDRVEALIQEQVKDYQRLFIDAVEIGLKGVSLSLNEKEWLDLIAVLRESEKAAIETLKGE